jgi:hypothetical protein
VPPAANSRASATPIPALAPVTSAHLPAHGPLIRLSKTRVRAYHGGAGERSKRVSKQSEDFAGKLEFWAEKAFKDILHNTVATGAHERKRILRFCTHALE